MGLVRRGVVAVMLTALTAMLIVSRGPWAGPVLLAVTPTHGLHVGDVAVLALWATGLAACLGRRPGR